MALYDWERALTRLLMSKQESDYCVFILSHGRAQDVKTVASLKKHGYTGKYFIVIDDEDDQAEDYVRVHSKEKVLIFNKERTAKTFDEADNFRKRQTVVYARNACFGLAKGLGFRYFIEMDDDYTNFDYRAYLSDRLTPVSVGNLDRLFELVWEFYKSTTFATVALAQGGDFIGGRHNRMAVKPGLYRKCMNTFFCDTTRMFSFVGRVNEDVNTYVHEQSKGLLMGTISMASITQKATQTNTGGMTDNYLESGTYVKSFYSVLFSPSCVTIRPMGDKHIRLHHSVNWDCAVPKFVPESMKK